MLPFEKVSFDFCDITHNVVVIFLFIIKVSIGPSGIKGVTALTDAQ